MRRTVPFTVVLLFAASCSALVRIEDDAYLGGEVSLEGDGDGDDTGGDRGDGDIGGASGDGDGDSGGSGDGDGDAPSGGMGGEASGGSGGTGGTGGGTGGGGTGGTPIEIPDPIHYYPLDGNTDDLGTGTALPATVTENVNWYPNAGVAGGTLEIPEPNEEYLALDPAVGNTNPYTISWWFIPSKDGYITLAHRFPQQFEDTWELILDTSSPRIKIGGTEYHFTYTFPSANEGTWTHIVFAYRDMASGTNDHFKLWIDGEVVLEQTLVLLTSAVVADAGFVFGQSAGGTQAFFGFVDELRVYDSFLTDQDVENLYLYDAP